VQNEIRYEAKFVPKVKNKEPAKLLCLSSQSSPLAQDFLGMAIRKRVS
jgi:hypothetical protein